jgi:hypothetical protein
MNSTLPFVYSIQPEHQILQMLSEIFEYPSPSDRIWKDIDAKLIDALSRVFSRRIMKKLSTTDLEIRDERFGIVESSSIH